MRVRCLLNRARVGGVQLWLLVLGLPSSYDTMGAWSGILRELGNAYFALERYALAEALLRRAVRALEGLAVALVELGDRLLGQDVPAP